MMHPAVASIIRLLVLVAGTGWVASACSSSQSVPSHADSGTDAQADRGGETTQADTGAETHADGNAEAGSDGGGCSEGLTRAPAGDVVCAGVAECALTTGQPDHQGCPNTCSCVCSSARCFVHACTAIASCTEPNTYR